MCHSEEFRGECTSYQYRVAAEGAVTLEDYWLRRSAHGLFDPDGGEAALHEAAAAMGPAMGLSDGETAAEAPRVHTGRRGPCPGRKEIAQLRVPVAFYVLDAGGPESAWLHRHGGDDGRDRQQRPCRHDPEG